MSKRNGPRDYHLRNVGTPMSKIAIVVGNPMRDSYSEALGQAYLRGAESGGHEAKLFLLARMHFDAILREGYRREQPLEPDLVAARAGVAGQRPPGVRVSALVRRHAGDHEGLHRARAATRPAGDPGQPQQGELEHPQGQIGAHHHDHGHAGLVLSLVLRRACAQTAQAQHPAFHRRLTGALHRLRHGRGRSATKRASNGCARSRRSGTRPSEFVESRILHW